MNYELKPIYVQPLQRDDSGEILAPRILSTQPTPESLTPTQIREDFQAGLLSREDALKLLGYPNYQELSKRASSDLIAEFGGTSDPKEQTPTT